jgi:hypothetical protein
MRQVICIVSLALVLWLFTPATTARAATSAKSPAGGVAIVVNSAHSAINLDKPGTDNGKGGDEVKVPKDKPKRSKKNDDKDGDPDDGNAGGGNDNKKLPHDGPQKD